MRAAPGSQVCADGGQDAAEAVRALQGAGYSEICQMEGGYVAYTRVSIGSAPIIAASTRFTARASFKAWSF